MTTVKVARIQNKAAREMAPSIVAARRMIPALQHDRRFDGPHAVVVGDLQAHE